MIKLCKYNKFHDEVLNYLADKRISAESAECLGRCDLCHSGAFVQVNEEFIADANVEGLIAKLKAQSII